MTRRLLAPLLVVALAVIAFGPVVDGGFVYDDHAYLLNNPAVTGEVVTLGSQLGEPVQGLWRPVTVLSWRAQWAGPETTAGRFHMLDLLLHIIASLLVLRLGRALGLSAVGACVGALLFAVHPTHAETVAWITARSELLATVLVLGAWIAHLRPAPLLAMALLAGACLAKENALVAPALFVLADMVLGTRPWPLRRWAGLAGVVVLVVVTRGVLLDVPLPDHGPFRELSLAERLPVAAEILAKSAQLLTWPSHLRIEYDRDEFLGNTGSAVLILAIALLTILVLFRRGAHRPALLLALTPVALLPVLHLIPIGEPFAERFLYLPSVTFCLAAGALLAALARREETRVGLGTSLLITGALLTASSIASRAAVAPFASDLALWRHAAQTAPHVPLARYNHGFFLSEARHDAARDRDQPGSTEELRASLELDPEHAFAAFAHQLLARYAYGQVGFGLPDPQAAVRHDRTALRLAPALVEPRLRLAEISLAAPHLVARAEAVELILPLLSAPSLDPADAEAAGAIFRQLAASSSPSSSLDAESPTGTSSDEGS